MADANDGVFIKKVGPYPIKAQLKLGEGSVSGDILKLTMGGFLIDLNNLYCEGG